MTKIYGCRCGKVWTEILINQNQKLQTDSKEGLKTGGVGGDFKEPVLGGVVSNDSNGAYDEIDYKLNLDRILEMSR